MAAAAPRCPSLVLMLLLLSCCGGALSAAAADEKLIHLRFYFHEVRAGQPNATVVIVASQHKNTTTFGNVIVLDNALLEGPDPASRLIGRAQGIVVPASLDGSSVFSALNFVFSGDHEYSGSSLATQGHFHASGSFSERSIVGGTGKLRFAQGYMYSRLVSSTDTSLVVVKDMYFTLRH